MVKVTFLGLFCARRFPMREQYPLHVPETWLSTFQWPSRRSRGSPRRSPGIHSWKIWGISDTRVELLGPSTAELGSALLPPLSPTLRGSCYLQRAGLPFPTASISHIFAVFVIIGRCSTSGPTISRCCIYAATLIFPRVVTISKSLGQLQILISAIINTTFLLPFKLRRFFVLVTRSPLRIPISPSH